MNFDNSTVASVTNLEGEAFVNRNGIEVPIRPEMALMPGDIIRSTQNSLVVISVPGSQGQIPAYMEVSSGAQAAIGFNPDLGKQGQVVISKVGEDVGNLVLVSEFDGENQAAVIEGQEGADAAMSSLFGAGLLGGSLLAPAAGTAVAAALFTGLSEDEESSDAPVSAVGGGGSSAGNGGNSGNGADMGGNTIGNSGGEVSTGPAAFSGGLSQTVSSLTNNLGELTSPVPVVSDVVDTVGNVLEAVLVGDNGGGVGGILSGVGEGFASGLEGTPLEPVGGALNMVFGTLGDGLSLLADQAAGAGEGTPLAPFASLVGGLLGTGGEGTESGVGGVVGTLSNVTDSLAQLLQPVPLFGELTGTLSSVVDSVSFGDNNGGLSSVVTGLGDGLEAGLAGTPLSLVGEGVNSGLDALGGALGTIGEQISDVGQGTPAEAFANLVGNLVGTDPGQQGDAGFSVPGLDGLLGSLSPSIGSGEGAGEGGLLGGLPLLGDLARNFG